MKSQGSHGNITWKRSPLIIILCHQNFEKKNIPEWRFLHLSLNISKSDHAFLGWTNNCLFVFYNQFFKHPPPLIMRSNSPQKLLRGGTSHERRQQHERLLLSTGCRYNAFAATCWVSLCRDSLMESLLACRFSRSVMTHFTFSFACL